MSRLFDPVQLGAFTARNRVVMAPMTRRFSPGGVPNAEVARYYLKRAEGGVGVIMTEGLEIDHPGSVGGASIPNFLPAGGSGRLARHLRGGQGRRRQDCPPVLARGRRPPLR